jgi:DinB family protein
MTQTFTPIDARRSLAETPRTLRHLLGTLPEEALTFREAPATWSAVEVLRHLADGEVHDWIPRARIILSDGDKRFTPFDRERGLRDYDGRSGAAMLDEFARLRADSLRAWDELRIDERDPSAQGIHPEFGAVTLGQLLACWVTHDLAHVNQISRVLMRRLAPAIGPWTRYFSLLRER